MAQVLPFENFPKNHLIGFTVRHHESPGIFDAVELLKRPFEGDAARPTREQKSAVDIKN